MAPLPPFQSIELVPYVHSNQALLGHAQAFPPTDDHMIE